MTVMQLTYVYNKTIGLNVYLNWEMCVYQQQKQSK